MLMTMSHPFAHRPNSKTYGRLTKRLTKTPPYLPMRGFTNGDLRSPLGLRGFYGKFSGKKLTQILKNRCV